MDILREVYAIDFSRRRLFCTAKIAEYFQLQQMNIKE